MDFRQLAPGAYGSLPPRRVDQLAAPPSPGMLPAPQNVFRARQLLIIGSNDGEFVYNSTGTLLLSSNVGAVTQDPILHIPCPQGFATYNGFGKVISLLSTANKAFFQYADQGAVQGQLISALSSASGVDPVAGFNYAAGLYGLDGFGGNVQVLGPVISISEVPFTRAAIIRPNIPLDNAHSPYLSLDAPEQVTASHLQMIMGGASPDGTHPGQLLIGTVSDGGVIGAQTGSTFEVQSSGVATSALSGVQPSVPAGSLGLDVRVAGDSAARACLAAGFNSAGAGVSAGDGAHAHDVILIRAAAGQWVVSQLDAIQPGTTNTTEPWHAFTGANSWAAAGGGLPAWQYRIYPDGDAKLTGVIKVPAGFAANQAVAAAVPAAYRPGITGPSFLGWNIGPAGTTKDIACRFYMTAGGVLNTSPAFPVASTAVGDLIAFEDQPWTPGQ